ncbi:MAG TPA: DUF4349 domain-containing protein [Candidatus Nanopelagicales bacterium]
MTSHDTQDRADDALRTLLGASDPEAQSDPTIPAPEHLLARVLTDVAADPIGTPLPVGSPPHPWAADGGETPAESRATHTVRRPRWQPWLLGAAAVASLALAAGTILPGLAGGGSDASLASADSAASDSSGAGAASLSETGSGAAAPAEGTVGADARAPQAGAATGTGTGTPTAQVPDQLLVRTATMLVGTDDPSAQRDAFVAAITTMGGRVTSESVVTGGGSGGGPEPLPASDMAVGGMGMSYPYPWYPSGPGIWLTVAVPVERYDEALAAARQTGEVVRLEQSSYDVATQVADVDARIEALEASLARLTALMDQANDVGDVIALEQAIAQRQSELDSLRAQQRALAEQTSMSTISLTLMSPDDAKASVDPSADQSWWDAFLEGLGQFWTWLGRALLIVTPLVLAMLVIWWARRRAARRSRATGGGAAGGSAGGGAGGAGPGAPTEPTPDGA